MFFSDLSREYKLAAEGFQLTRDELFDISYRSIDAIFEDDAEKAKLQNIWLEWKKQHDATYF